MTVQEKWKDEHGPDSLSIEFHVRIIFCKNACEEQQHSTERHGAEIERYGMRIFSHAAQKHQPEGLDDCTDDNCCHAAECTDLGMRESP